MTIADSERTYLPAAGRDIFLPLYDSMTRVLGVDSAREALLTQAELEPRHRVLDIGCGTGTFAVLIRRRCPAVEVVGLDPDPKALARARIKAKRTGLAVRFDMGFSDLLPYPDGAFDRVFSSMMFHHLDPDTKGPTMREIHRVLKPGGRLELMDFAGAGTGAHGALARLVHSHHRLRDNDDQRVLALMRQAGFAAKKVGDRRTLVARLAFYQAWRP